MVLRAAAAAFAAADAAVWRGLARADAADEGSEALGGTAGGEGGRGEVWAVRGFPTDSLE